MKQERETDKRLISPEKMTDAELQAAAGFFGSYRSCHYGRQVIDMIRSRSRNAGPRCLSKGDVLLGIFPENISKLEYGSYGFNPENDPVSVEWRSYPVGVSRYDDIGQGNLSGDIHVCIRCVKDGNTIYSAAFDDLANNRPDSGKEPEFGNIWRYSSMDAISGFSDLSIQEKDPEIQAVIHQLDVFLKENAPHGVSDISGILNGLNEFRSLRLRRHPLDVSREKFDRLLLDELQKDIDPMYQDMVTLTIAGSELYVYVPGWLGRGVSVTDDATEDCPSVSLFHEGFCDGTLSLGVAKEIALSAIRNIVGSWEPLKYTFCYDRIRDMITPEKISREELADLDRRCRRQSIGYSVESTQRNGELYVFRIYPFRGNEAFQDKSFLVTTEMTSHWNLNKYLVLDDALDEYLRQQEKKGI